MNQERESRREKENIEFYKEAKSMGESKDLIRHDNNRIALSRVFDEILYVSKQIRSTTDISEKTKLERRYELLANKYAFSDGLNGEISHEWKA